MRNSMKDIDIHFDRHNQVITRVTKHKNSCNYKQRNKHRFQGKDAKYYKQRRGVKSNKTSNSFCFPIDQLFCTHLAKSKKNQKGTEKEQNRVKSDLHRRVYRVQR